ncbi:beta-ketoacyl synthase N-terminal-like domain-containing protein [Desulfatitalea tepidiphila]|uniref:beta-ketoacyl synthase N-terminal-like domain-containing protein n=1 Tax=Desulfatitalea tepidiphila TaxID=1185843 RepID=UPI0006B555BB|nr:beta-ketoacyl synthase N-terminal-like domain-containing protein [Desulfatitalea tepidiphila]
MNDKPLIAIVGMSGVFPKATGLSMFWHNIVNKVDATVEIPDNRWPVAADWTLDDTPIPDKAYSRRACLIQNFSFDADRFFKDGCSYGELEPLHQWVLHAVDDAVLQCSLDAINKQRIGTILAAIALPTAASSAMTGRFYGDRLLNSAAPEIEDCLKTHSGAMPADACIQNRSKVMDPSVRRDVGGGSRIVSAPAALVARVFGFGGGTFTLDAACASSIFAVKLACDELQAFRADAMIAGGVSGADTVYTQIGFSQLRALSRSGRCAPFDASADGLLVGEGAGILVLKRLDDALRDGDTVYGVIHGIGLSNDMRGNLLAPDSEGQLRAMRSAYAAAGWQPWEVDYIECHGAGTPVGDATELKSLCELWREAPADHGPCGIGSVKSMIGHLLTGAGAAGMIKTLLALHHGTLPPSLKFEKPGANSPLIGAPFHVQTEPADWPLNPAGRPPRAAVSAFGFGGINGHVLFEKLDAKRAIKSSPSPANISAAPSIRHDIDVTGVAPAPCDIAIVGIEVALGPLASRTAFQQAVFNGKQALIDPPQTRWRISETFAQLNGKPLRSGGFVAEVSVELGEFQIPPGEIPDILPQQLLMLKVAAGAMADAGLPLRQPRVRMGTIIGIGFDYEATNFHLRWVLPEWVPRWREAFGLRIDDRLDDQRIDAWLIEARDTCGPPLTPTRTLGALGGIVASRIAREFRFGGPSFVVSAEEASGLRAVELAVRLLQSGQTDAMLVGAVDLNCDERNLASRFSPQSLSAGGRIHSFDRNADGTLPGEGAVALVLKRLADAQAHGDRIYAVIKGIAGAHAGEGDTTGGRTAAYVRSMSQALSEGGVSASHLGLVETHGSAIPEEDDVESAALHSLFAGRLKEKGCAIAVGALQPIVGHTGAVAGLGSLVKAALCLHHCLLPAMPHFQAPRSDLWRDGPFHFPRQTVFWTRNRKDGPRHACVASMTADGNCMQVVMSEAEALGQPAEMATSQVSRPMGALPYGLFVVRGMDAADVLQRLDLLHTRVGELHRPESQPIDAIMETLAHQWHLHQPAAPHPGHAVAIVASSPDDLIDSIQEARSALHSGTQRQMGPRGGLCHFPEERFVGGRLAFVFPGSGNHEVGMGRTLGAHWPEVLQAMDAGTDRLHDQMLPHLYDPRRIDWPDGWQAESYRAIASDPLHMIFGQVIFGVQMARLLKKFLPRPEAAIGYSLGESAALFGLGAWPDHGQMLERLAASDLFKTELSGPCRALQQAWGLTGDQPVDWRVAVVNRPVDQVDRAIADTPHVRRLIINTPNECVIGGLAGQIQKVVATLKCEALYLDGVVTVHCDAARPVADAYRALHHFPETKPVDGVRFYSCAGAQAYTVTPDAAADAILAQALHGFDYPRTIEQAYADGVRIFVEAGPQSSCTRMIRQILGDRPHLAVAAHVRGEHECLTLLKCLGTLAAAGVAVDLDALYCYPEDDFKAGKKPSDTAIRVTVGGPPITLPPLPRVADAAEPQSVAVSVPVADRTTPRPGVSKPDALEGDAADSNASIPLPNNAQTQELSGMLAELKANVAAMARAHQAYLDLSQEMTREFGKAFEMQNTLMQALAGLQEGASASTPPPEPAAPPERTPAPAASPVAFDRDQCLAFAIGSVGAVLGPEFDVVDTYKVRVRLPDEPLMLVDRIVSVEGEKCSLGSGRVVTEHDVLPGAWYLDGGRAPVCISVEAGQADLFLCSYLGIDHQVKGERSYRLLDAKIRFHRGLPQPGETIRYDIHIDRFVKQGPTYLFFFRYEGHISDQHLITMTDGCAGFFTEEEVRNSGGIILTDEDRSPAVRVDGESFAPLVPVSRESYDDRQVEALRTGRAETCFGESFKGIGLPPALRLPGGRMRLIDRVVALDPKGGPWGLGTIRAEADIHPDDWFLTCHFVDDKVMPGTLMYECCAHTLRVLLLRLGWITDRTDACYEPVLGIPCRLKCRGPVTPSTRQVHYELEIKEIGYKPEPYVIADAHMYADGHNIVFFKDMSMQMSGVSAQEIRRFWQARAKGAAAGPVQAPSKPALYTQAQILAFAVGRPSEAFGDKYRIFDSERRIARLPGPPYCFMDRVIAVEPEPWIVRAGGWVEAQYDVPADAWYFAADRSGVMPFCVLLEIALQPCGWLAAYAGSALKSQRDLKFRNLGGQGTVHANLLPGNQILTMRTRMTKVSEAADMIIEHFDFEVWSERGKVYTGNTYFGFFTAQALAQQVGLRESVFTPDAADIATAQRRPFPDEAPFVPDEVPGGVRYRPEGLALPAKSLLMIDAIEVFNHNGGPHGLGFVRGSKLVDPSEWFFKAHFYQDPVCPGSLGVESFLQLVKFAAMRRWPELNATHRFETLCGRSHDWQYRGQVIPANKMVQVDAVITRIEEGDEPVIMADGWLHVDGICIYKMKDFGIRLARL